MLRKIWQCLNCWEPPLASPDEIATAQVIVTQAVEYDRDNTPGPGNAILAEIAFRYARTCNLQVIPQKELLGAARPTMPCVAVVGNTPMRTAAGVRPAHTATVCREQAEICRQHGWTRVLVITFPDHWWRTVMCYRKLGLVPLVPYMPSHQEARYYGPNAIRWHMRRRWTFRIYEVAARLYFLYKGWL
jgi:hypothetical protein